jgi:hypothetical protein
LGQRETVWAAGEEERWAACWAARGREGAGQTEKGPGRRKEEGFLFSFSIFYSNLLNLNYVHVLKLRKGVR